MILTGNERSGRKKKEVGYKTIIWNCSTLHFHNRADSWGLELSSAGKIKKLSFIPFFDVGWWPNPRWRFPLSAERAKLLGDFTVGEGFPTMGNMFRVLQIVLWLIGYCLSLVWNQRARVGGWCALRCQQLSQKNRLLKKSLGVGWGTKFPSWVWLVWD